MPSFLFLCIFFKVLTMLYIFSPFILLQVIYSSLSFCKYEKKGVACWCCEIELRNCLVCGRGGNGWKRKGMDGREERLRGKREGQFDSLGQVKTISSSGK